MAVFCLYFFNNIEICHNVSLLIKQSFDGFHAIFVPFSVEFNRKFGFNHSGSNRNSSVLIMSNFILHFLYKYLLQIKKSKNLFLIEEFRVLI